MCNKTEEELVIKAGYVCFSTSYLIWDILNIIIFLINFIWSVYCFIKMLNRNESTASFITIILNILTSIIRIIFFIFLINGRNFLNNPSFELIDIILINVGQIFILTSFFSIIIIWKIILNKSSSMKYVSNADFNKTIKYSIFSAFCLIFIVLPLSIIRYSVLNVISNYMKVCLLIYLIYKGNVYSYRINKLLKKIIDFEVSLIKNTSKINTIKVISMKRKKSILHMLFLIRTLNFLGIIAIACLAVNTFGLYNTNEAKIWGFWFPVHLSESLVLFCLSSSISDKSRKIKT